MFQGSNFLNLRIGGVLYIPIKWLGDKHLPNLCPACCIATAAAQAFTAWSCGNVPKSSSFKVKTWGYVYIYI